MAPGQISDYPSSVHPMVLCVAGMDPTGGAGLLADVAALAAIQVRAAGVITAQTNQHPNRPAQFWTCDPEQANEQLTTLLADFPIRAIKIGMLGSAAMAKVVARHLKALPAGRPIVIDPVLEAGAGGALADVKTLDVLRSEIIPRATLVTPNLPEAELILGQASDPVTDLETMAQRLRRMGAAHVLLKGGHGPGDPIDLLLGPAGGKRWTRRRHGTREIHGTGCMLAALIAGFLATGHPVEAAVDQAIKILEGAIYESWPPLDKGWMFLGRCGPPG